VHGPDAARRVDQASQALFGRGELAGLDERTLAEAVSELPTVTVPRHEHAVVDLLAGTGLVTSRSAGRRAITEGGAYVNNQKVDSQDAVVGVSHLLHGRWVLLRRGRRALAAVRFAD
jgi:tyrosyl-tRNA synthetase